MLGLSILQLSIHPPTFLFPEFAGRLEGLGKDRIGAGIDHLAEADVPEHVTITNAAGVAAAPIAEFAMSRLLSVCRRPRLRI